MSQSNTEPVASSSKSDTLPEDERRLKKASLTKLIETTSWKLNFLQVLDDRIDTPFKPLLRVPSEILTLRCQHSRPNISFKSLPPLHGVKNSSENLLKIGKYSEFPRKYLLRSFVKTNNLERRPRRRLCQNKCEMEARIHVQDQMKSQQCPELNLKNGQHQLAIERKILNRSVISKFGQKIRNHIKGDALKGQLGTELPQGLSYEKVDSWSRDDAMPLQFAPNDSNALSWSQTLGVKKTDQGLVSTTGVCTRLNESYSNTEILHSLENLNLNPEKCGKVLQAESLETSVEISDEKTPVELVFKNDNSNTWFENISTTKHRVDGTSLFQECNNEYGLNFQKLKESECRMEHLPGQDDAGVGSCSTKVDFSSGDDSRNVTSKLMTNTAESNSKMTVAEERQNQDYESRKRSVQWNSEVDVIYYAGDTDGGQVVRRKVEPLREEADQQARRNGFVKLALNKNLISALNGYYFQEPWVTVFHDQKLNS